MPKFGYKDMVLCTAENWDPRLGLNYLKKLEQHMSFQQLNTTRFWNWDSDLTEWNAGDKGKKRLGW